jgi:hypothetical protein
MRRNVLISILLLSLLILLFCYNSHVEPFISYSNKAILIVEPREHKDLEKVLIRFDEQIPADWDLYIFHGISHEAYARKAASSLTSSRQILFNSLDTDNLTAQEYNKLFKDKTFWDKVYAENILVFQTDSSLCKKSDSTISDFIQYDYIGCGYFPTSIAYEKTPWVLNDRPKQFYGVGGLSFRKKSFMMKCISKYPNVDQFYPEDVFFSECVAESSNKPVSAKTIAKFCSQDTFSQKSFGAHKTKSMIKEDQTAFYEYCPESEFLKEQFKTM